mmetsp:Transcript_38269/g.81683  ORF Transcript_38269/g.81683 Transcript_38269/m.81683 type:complete len:681 (-) Transcript_38269:121-2163(-)
MSSAHGWARVAKGLRLVAADGASRVASAVVTSNVANRHLPELAESIARAGGRNVAVVRNEMRSPARGSMADKPRSGGLASAVGTDGDGGQFADSSREHPSFSSVDGAKQQADFSIVVNGMGGATLHEEEDVSNLRLDVISNDKHATVDDPAETDDREADSTGPIMHHNNHDDTSESTDQMAQAGNQQLESYSEEDDESPHLLEGSAVPSTRLSRAFGFASLGAGLAMGTVAELARRTFGASQNGNNGPLVLSNDANAQRLSESLRRMRGAAMKLGQMLSIQDESIAPPALTNALAQVRRGAEAMPQGQLMRQLEDEWGEGWRERIKLEERPFAAASIGQVHRGTISSPSTTSDITKVAVKVQYPGVADSIESDLSNLSMLVKATGLAPPGLFLENVIRVGREELKIECDYRREAENQRRFQTLIISDPSLVADRFVVPKVLDELSTSRILVTELVRGGTIDKVVDLDQSERNRIGKAIMRLTMLELFVWRFMQTDPNWGNFLYDVRTRTTYLIDFGAAREYDEGFVRGYLNIVVANANRDEGALVEESIRMGFLTGEENDVMLEAHKMSGFCLGEPFRSHDPYNFGSSKITSRISEHGSVFLRHRLTPPPEEVYTLHRKLAGAYNLCIKLGANISCRDLLDEVMDYQKKQQEVTWTASASTSKALLNNEDMITGPCVKAP